MGGCQEGLEWCLCIRIWIFDIFAPLLEKAAEFIVLIYLIQGHEYKWALMMAIAMLLPGTVPNFPRFILRLTTDEFQDCSNLFIGLRCVAVEAEARMSM